MTSTSIAHHIRFVIFVPMKLKISPLRYLVRCSAVMALIVLFVGCGSFLAKDEPEYLARVGENYLYREDVAKLLAKGISKEDSASFVTNYINNWASKQLLLGKAKINLPEEKLAEYDVLVSDYRTDLYTRAYKEALVQQSGDTVISSSQLNGFYEREKENFKLKEKIVKLRFVELPTQFLNKEDVISKLKRFKKNDITYLDSIGVQFKKLNFNDSIWVSAARVIEEIPPLTFENASKHLKKSQFFELEDANGVYLAKVTDVLDINDIAPLSFIEPTIKQVLLSRRKLDYLRKLETEIIDEAIKEKEFEVYE
ncbi:peptidyl-prolyl cis-trans isomerase [Zobellia alginiliquefaciens]|uniref:peptidyl-prolyl cis-trans isomerase n=1 Tax=Zobellia alginiliquefaciens TaxID=3032586 RepID=UPI0023E3521D|nr:peptidyl-prolyl cis-trans isomerase [Zobellia alginiliquefaciens]